jgi:hypothetical protein
MRGIGAGLAAPLLAGTAMAADLNVALQADTTSMDQHVAPTFPASAASPAAGHAERGEEGYSPC